MLKALAVTGLALVLLSLSVGCDQLAASNAAAGVEKFLPAAKMLRSGSGDMDQMQDRDQLRDGTGAYCPGGNGSTAQGGAGGGQGDRLRLRDGTCKQ